MNLTIKLPPHSNPLDETLMRGSGEEYFWPRLCKHHPEKMDAGPRGVELEAIDCEKERAAQYTNMRQRKRVGMKKAVKI